MSTTDMSVTDTTVTDLSATNASVTWSTKPRPFVIFHPIQPEPKVFTADDRVRLRALLHTDRERERFDRCTQQTDKCLAAIAEKRRTRPNGPWREAGYKRGERFWREEEAREIKQIMSSSELSERRRVFFKSQEQ